MEKKYVVSIKTPNRMFVINGRQVRTPFIKTVNHEQMLTLKNRFSSEGIMNYSITEYIEPIKSDIKPIVQEVKINEQKPEKKSKIKSSTLSNLINEPVNS